MKNNVLDDQNRLSWGGGGGQTYRFAPNNFDQQNKDIRCNAMKGLKSIAKHYKRDEFYT